MCDRKRQSEREYNSGRERVSAGEVEWWEGESEREQWEGESEREQWEGESECGGGRIVGGRE